MADNNTNPQMDLQTQAPNPATVAPKEYFSSPVIRKKFTDILGGETKANAFMASMLQVVNGNDNLKNANVLSIYNSAAIAATLDLPINQNLGFAWIVPYAGNAQFQLGYKGFIQLAMRTGQYSRLNVVEVYKNQFISYNELTEDLQANFGTYGEGPVVGYVGYFRLINGFEKTVFWTMQKVTAHAKKFSKAYDRKDSIWKSDFDSMAKKTVLKNMLSKWGILSIEMNKALVVDQAVIRNEEGTDVVYPDNEEDLKDRADQATDEAVQGMKGLTNKAAGK